MATIRILRSTTINQRSIARSFSTALPPPLYITDKTTTKVISPFHDIPWKPTNNPTIYNFVCEIPKGVLPPKLEIDTDKPFNPIVQDKTKDGKPRFYKLDSLIHYGAIPQTYEDPNHKDKWTGLLGDGDPIDVCDIAVNQVTKPGHIYQVKVLGILGMIDGGETDWKVLAVRSDDPLASKVSNITTAPDQVKKLADDIREWFRTYKIPEGKGENSFAFDGKWLDQDTAIEIIQSTHEQWKTLINNPVATDAKKKGPWVPAKGWTVPSATYLQGNGSELLTSTTLKLA